RGRGWLVNVGDLVVIDEEGTNQVVSRVSNVGQLIREGYYRLQGWNEYRIVARGNHVVHYLNGYPTIELIDRDAQDRLREGILALQIHTGPPMIVEFKDIRIKHLNDNYGEAQLLFNGQNLDGWTYSSPRLGETWSVVNGVLSNGGSPSGYIRTTRDYTNYVLRLQMRHLTDGNSGVLLRKVGEDKVWPRSVESQGQRGNMGDMWNIDKFPMEVDPDRTEGRRTSKMHPSNERPLGEWNEYEIYLNQGDLRVYVNGLLQNRAREVWETPGKICLQSEGARLEYRNIVLIPIQN
ncbi:MAG TPA: DUF1080 domain-containing protein, partial [bacterium]|nr:DUF1080 domain-containing protein [bacterium]